MEQDPRGGEMQQTGALGGRRGRASSQARVLSGERHADERSADEREAQDRDQSDEDALELFRDTMQQSVLPDLPLMPGYHIFWATTSNPRDSVQRRIQLGYELIKTEDIPGWDGVTHTTGEFAGVVAINEMVAMRIPLTRYNKFMREVHHRMPLDEEVKLRSMTDSMKERAAAMGARLEEGDGTAEIVQRAGPPPEFDA